MSEDPTSHQDLALWREVELAMAGVDDEQDRWIVVLEFAPKLGERVFEMSEVTGLVDSLVDWSPTALFAPDRYAIQVQVNTVDPAQVIPIALAAHGQAVSVGAIRPSTFVRAEFLTRAEFTSDRAQPGVIEDPNPEAPSLELVSADADQATRDLVAATTPSEVIAALVSFVYQIGGTIHRGAHDRADDEIAMELGVDHGVAVTACAEEVSVAGLLLEHWLPGLLADAGVALGRIATASTQRRRHLPWPARCGLTVRAYWVSRVVLPRKGGSTRSTYPPKVA